MTKPHAIFILGAPRSGTKLLRHLLNNHSDISLGHEGNYIPVFVRRFGIDADLSQRSVQQKIYQEFSRTAFYTTQIKDNGIELSATAFMDALASREGQELPITWSSIFEVLLRAYGPKPEARIYGDKSHGYMDAATLTLLRTVLDDVRFIFIVRDPRDQALSALKTWGRHPLRSAHHWLSVARSAERLGFDAAPDVITVRYEDLTDNTGEALKRLCTFLQVPYEPDMAALKGPAEREIRGRQLKSVTKQHAKYRNALSARVVKSVSEITLPYLARYGYPDEGATRHRTLTPTRLRLMSLSDGFATLQFHMKEKGWLKGASYYLRRHFESSSAKRLSQTSD